MEFKRRRRILNLEEEESRGQRRRQYEEVRQLGIWPLNAPGMPPPGPDFLSAAKALGDETVFEKKKKEVIFEPDSILSNLYLRALREPGFRLNVVGKGNKRSSVEFIPGHIWGQHQQACLDAIASLHLEATPVDGPRPADVFVLGKMPWREELSKKRNFVGPTGETLSTIMERLHIRGGRKWYITNLIKFMPPDDTTTIKASWLADCLPLLAMELRLVRPKYILCLGADASKALLGKKFNVSYMEGRVVDFRFPMHLDHNEDPEEHLTHVMTVLHPAQVSREPSLSRTLERGLGRFALLSSGVRFDLEEKDLDHRVCDTLEDAEDWVEEVNAELAKLSKQDKLIGIDAEWQGQHPCNEGSYLRTVQLAWAHKKSICFKLAHIGGKTAFRDRDGEPAIKRLMALLSEFMRDKRAVGHFLVSDLEWLVAYGFDPTACCPVPIVERDGKAAWEQLRDGEGWLDTAMMAHAIEETAMLGLESLLMRYTTVPRYDITLTDWKKDYCKTKNMPAAALEGYGECPDHILHPYANYDADGTRRLAFVLMDLLDKDYEENDCWEPFWESMIIQKVLLEMHQNGIMVDRARVDDLTKSFLEARAKQEQEIRHWSRWDDFNIRSTYQVREFLFGEELNGKVVKPGKESRIRPEGAKSLYIEPLLDTSKPPRRWVELKEKKQTAGATPGTGKLILSILAQENTDFTEQINWVRDYRFLDQVLKSILRPPLEDDEGKWIQDEDGFFEYDAGLIYCIDDDGRVRTHLYPTAETGRWKSARPNLQNISKSRDPDYKRLLGAEKYKHKLRSVLMASPGKALIEFDYIGAELFGMAIMSGSAKMMDHCLRANTWPESGFDIAGHACSHGTGCKQCVYPHPEYYDIHSNIAIMAFRLRCHASKTGLASIGKGHFRTLAKNVIFGIAYGRGAKAIALQAKEQGVQVSVDEAQTVIDAIFKMYPELVGFFNEAKSRASEDKWLRHCFGRYRRFPVAGDYKLEGEFERQAQNFPIQGMVASMVDRGLAILQYQRDVILGRPELFDMLLQMHDAGLIEAPYEYVGYLTSELIPYAMSKCVPIYPTKLDGVPTGAGPYYMGLDIKVQKHWGEDFSLEECQEFGIPTKFAAA